MASTSTTTLLLLRCLLVVTLFLSSLSVPSTAQIKGCPLTSIYTFGDGDSSTSDGSTMSDHLAVAFHLPSPEPYSSGTTTKSTHGATFATAGATVMSTFFFVQNDIQFPRHPLPQSLATQLENFFGLVQGTKDDLHRAILFLDQLGANDYKLAFLQGKSIEEVSSYVPKVVEGVKETIMRKLINAGAKNLFVTGVPPIGCLPGYLTLLRNKDPMQYDSNNCLRGLDEFSRLHNDHLRQALMELSMEFPDVQIVYGDYYKAFVALLRNRVLLGFKKETLMTACCGFGDPFNFHPKEMCKGVEVCSNPREFVNWDGFHLTQEALKHVVEAFVAGRGFVYPEFKFPAEVMHCIMK